MRSVMKHRFSEVPSVEIPRSTFDRSHGHKTTFDGSYLIPVFLDQEIYPGDTVSLRMTGFARMSTPTYPVMDNMFLSTFFFFVPFRLLWTNWTKFMGEQVDPGDSIDYTIPQVTLNNESNMTLWDYFGLPTQVAANLSVNNFAGRAYNLIWNDWFRDENLQDSLTVELGDGPDTKGNYTLQKRGKRHDYFCSSLPFLQKGDAVQLSLGTDAPVEGIGIPSQTYASSSGAAYETDGSGTVTYASYRDENTQTSTYIEEDPNNSGYPNIRANLANATASTVNELRQSVQIQKLLEKDARAGTRYKEIVKSHFGVDSADARLDRPEFLGGGTTPVTLSAIPRTDSSPGELGAMGTIQFNGHGFTQSFTEHGLIMGLACVTADLTYQEGVERSWNNQTRYDLYFPVLAHLGEQAVLNQEIYCDAATLGAGTNDDVFGYQERYAHLRYKPSRITGKFRSNDAGTLDAWHLGIEFGSLPTLDDTFIVDSAHTAIDRVIATPTEPQFIFDSWFNYQHTRPMPVYSVPGYIDHF